MAHKDLVDCGLAKAFGFSPVVSADDPRAAFIGKTVRIKRELLFHPDGKPRMMRHPLPNEDGTHSMMHEQGSLAMTCTYLIKEVQNNWRDQPILRGYCNETGDTFGRPMDVEKVEIMPDDFKPGTYNNKAGEYGGLKWHYYPEQTPE